MTSAQNDSIQNERYEVINAIYNDLNVDKYGKIELDKNFFIFLGLQVIIGEEDLIDNLSGTCSVNENELEYSYSEILSNDDISAMRKQIDWMPYYKTLDSTLISDKIKLSNQNDNTKTAITLPLIHNDKALVFRTNKNNQETLFVLMKEKEKWIIKCVKNLYLRFDD